MTDSKAGGYISQIHFKSGEFIELQKNDIVVFVGPNNAGKSQCLRDMYALAEGKNYDGIVVSDITIKKYDAPLKPLLDSIAKPRKTINAESYNVLNNEIHFYEHTERYFSESTKFGDFAKLFIGKLDTSARLEICKPAGNIARNDPKTHPIHYAAFNSKYRTWLSDSFKKAFSIELTPNTQYGAKIPLCIGKPVQLEDKFEDEQSRQEAYAAILETYKQVQDQGDGVKSFTGILLHLMLDYRCVFLIDEPEAFLHPPQAKIMGQLMGKKLSKQQQAFIATHSEEIIKGLIDEASSRLKIVRITREEDANQFSILNSDSFAALWKDPLLKYSNIMSSLFHKTVVLCESDSDCKMYSLIEGHIKQKQGSYSETLFIHCGGKYRMAKISSALKALRINVKLIPDIDVLNDKKVFRGIVEAFGCDWNDVDHYYRTIVSNLQGSKIQIERCTAKNIINKVFDDSSEKFLSRKEIDDIRNAVKTVSQWKNIKSEGVKSLPLGDATNAFNQLNNILKKVGIYIVPVGELECFIKKVGGHGPEWSNAVLEKFPDLNDEVYSKIKEFIQGMNL